MLSPVTDPLIGTLVGGKYRLVRLLGQGGMGAVYEALQEGLNRRCAVKVLHETLAQDATLVARFKREAEVAASLGHANIVQVTDFGYDDGKAFLVMDYLDGQPLADLMEAGALDPERVRFIVSQVLSALEAAHAREIVHRDLKPDNVYLTAISGVRDMVKLLDFGIARITDEQSQKMTTTGQVLGTPAYMSPEQARGRPVDVRTDLYSLGVMMYEMLTTRMPVSGSNYHELMFAIVGETPTPIEELRPDLDAGLVAVVRRAMQKEPEARFQTATEMRAAIDALGPLRVGAPQAVGLAGPSEATVPSIGTDDAFGKTMTPAALAAVQTADGTVPSQTPAAVQALASGANLPPVVDAVPTTPPAKARSLWPLALVGAAVVLVGGGFWALRAPDAPPAMDGPPTVSASLTVNTESDSETNAESASETETESDEARVARLVQEALRAEHEAEAAAEETARTETTMTESAMTESVAVAMSRVGAPGRMASHMSANDGRPTMDAYGNRITWVACGDDDYVRDVYPISAGQEIRATSWNGGRVVELDHLRPMRDAWSAPISACYRGHNFMNGQNFILTIDAEGKVQGVTARRYCPIDPSVVQCVRNLIEGHQFPPGQNAPGTVTMGLGLRGA